MWWGPASAAYPAVLDCLHVSDSVPHWAELAAVLLQAGQDSFRRAGSPGPPRYELRLPSAWRASPDTLQAARWRREAAARAGLTDELERIRFEWTPAAGLPRSSGRLTFRPEPDDEAFISVFRQVARGSLDVTTRRDVAARGAGRQAREDFALYRDMPGDRDWWRLAYTADGELAGMILPNRNPYGAVVGYLGVLPGMRGHGYIDDLVTETTRFHAARGEPRITATTDTTNQPVADAFRRAGYREAGIRYVFSAPAEEPR
ncbi:MAG TPA: GNAT family N-acetyltransferase [Streptosporangiaceae bacterium]|nr:GNAT family N-acetyltransferase [Streptosporangiaceae bacterium]